MAKSLNLDDIIGVSVLAGAPGEEEEDVVFDVTWTHGDKVFIEFESGHTTNMSVMNLQHLLEEGQVEYESHVGFMGSMKLTGNSLQ